MKDLPKIHWVDDPNLGKLIAWLEVRNADLALREPADHETVSVGEEPGEGGSGLQILNESATEEVQIVSFDLDIQVGDIRLLSPQLTPNANRPVYVAVFKQWEDDLVLVAPFSPYSFAATRTELEFQDRTHALQVLCPWNAHTIHPISIADSWLVDRLSETELADTWQVFRHAAVGYDLPEELVSRVGCPIMRIDDPRVAYQTEEADVMGFVSALNMEVSDVDNEQDEGLPINEIQLASFDFEPLPLAARTHESQQIPREEYRIAGLQSYICLYKISASSEVVLMVYERNGESCRQLDFSVVLGSSEERLATIRNGIAKWRVARALGSASILLPSGQRLKLLKREQ